LVTRRNFIVWYLATLLTATVVAAIAPILVYLYPPATGNKKQSLTVTLQTPLDQLKDGDGVRFDAPKNAAFVMLDGGGDNAPGDPAFSGYAVKWQGKVNVFAVNCSHLGCSINLDTAGKKFACPCHGSQFNLAGDVIHGPAIAPLSHLGWKQGGSPNEIVVQGMQLLGLG
jgi:menaquinol-cytochrome c reductase iron-sulfur subunit